MANLPMKITFSVNDVCINNASPDCSHAGGYYRGPHRDEAIRKAKELSKVFGCTRRPDREDERRIYFADKREPWAKRNTPSCPSCDKLGFNKPPRGIPRGLIRHSGPEPRLMEPFAKHTYVEVIRSEEFDYEAMRSVTR